MSVSCPYCEPLDQGSWAMGPEGWERMLTFHEARHVLPAPPATNTDRSNRQ